MYNSLPTLQYRSCGDDARHTRYAAHWSCYRTLHADYYTATILTGTTRASFNQQNLGLEKTWPCNDGESRIQQRIYEWEAPLSKPHGSAYLVLAADRSASSGDSFVRTSAGFDNNVEAPLSKLNGSASPGLTTGRKASSMTHLPASLPCWLPIGKNPCVVTRLLVLRASQSKARLVTARLSVS
jgi:hypothetical protein